MEMERQWSNSIILPYWWWIVKYDTGTLSVLANVVFELSVVKSHFSVCLKDSQTLLR
jgi:hypothetical protein